MWQASDDESLVAEQHLSVMTSDPEHLNIPALKVRELGPYKPKSLLEDMRSFVSFSMS